MEAQFRSLQLHCLRVACRSLGGGGEGERDGVARRERRTEDHKQDLRNDQGIRLFHILSPQKAYTRRRQQDARRGTGRKAKDAKRGERKERKREKKMRRIRSAVLLLLLLPSSLTRSLLMLLFVRLLLRLLGLRTRDLRGFSRP